MSFESIFTRDYFVVARFIVILSSSNQNMRVRVAYEAGCFNILFLYIPFITWVRKEIVQYLDKKNKKHFLRGKISHQNLFLFSFGRFIQPLSIGTKEKFEVV